jgi:hypothetical protein
LHPARRAEAKPGRLTETTAAEEEAPALKELSQKLDFWLYEVPEALTHVAHSKLVAELRAACSQVAECLGSPHKTSLQAFTYKTISACPWPCGCADFYGGLKEASA